MSPTKKEIDAAIEELRLAMHESIDIDQKDKDIKLKKAKSHYRLMKAKEEIRTLKVEIL